MILDLSSLMDPATGILASGFLVFLRIGSALAFLPAFGEMIIPVRVRLMAALAFTAITLPVVEAEIAERIARAGPLVFLAGAEVVVGLLIGVSLRLLVWALHVTASIAAQATSLAQLLGGASVDPQPAIGMILLWGALAVAASMGLHVRFAALFILSYDILGPGQMPQTAETARWLFPAVSRTFEFAFLAAMPFVAASLLYNLTLGVINKAMPQLMVAFVGAPAITFGAILLLWLSAPLLLALWVAALEALTTDPFGPR